MGKRLVKEEVIMTHWKNLHDFLAMGGYATTVWSSYGLVAVSIGVLALSAKKRLKRLVSALKNRVENP